MVSKSYFTGEEFCSSLTPDNTTQMISKLKPDHGIHHVMPMMKSEYNTQTFRFVVGSIS